LEMTGENLRWSIRTYNFIVFLLISIAAFIPLCENMPSGTATRPGDVVTAMNGKTIQVCTVNIWAYLLYKMM